jgi:hypothetical protein
MNMAPPVIRQRGHQRGHRSQRIGLAGVTPGLSTFDPCPPCLPQVGQQVPGQRADHRDQRWPQRADALP